MQRVQVSQPAAVQVAQPIQKLQVSPPASSAAPDASSIEMYTDKK